MTGKEWSKFLYDYDVYDAYQFISNSWKTMGIALYCKEMILALISQMGEEHQRWQSDLFEQLLGKHRTILAKQAASASDTSGTVDNPSISFHEAH